MRTATILETTNIGGTEITLTLIEKTGCKPLWRTGSSHGGSQGARTEEKGRRNYAELVAYFAATNGKLAKFGK